MFNSKLTNHIVIRDYSDWLAASMFNKLKEVGGKLRERTQSIRSDSGSASGASLGSGFHCPDCKQSFGESDQLQFHWQVCLSRSVPLTDISLPEEDNLGCNLIPRGHGTIICILRPGSNEPRGTEESYNRN